MRCSLPTVIGAGHLAFTAHECLCDRAATWRSPQLCESRCRTWTRATPRQRRKKLQVHPIRSQAMVASAVGKLPGISHSTRASTNTKHSWLAHVRPW